MNQHPSSAEQTEREERREFAALQWFAVVVTLIVVISALVIGRQIGEEVQNDAPPLHPARTATNSAEAPAGGSTKTASASAGSSGAVPQPGAQAASSPGPVKKTAFAPPAADQIPEGPMGDVIRQGEQIFLHTGANAKGFVGNTLNCVNCHLDAGRLANSAPLWGAYLSYPAYRSKTKSVSTFSERLRGCFMYSMNGKAPPDGHEVLVALETYSYWMAKGATVGEKLPGSGFVKLPAPEKTADYARGKAVYEAQCALCHGANGEGQRSGDVQVFPPLWGAQSYNWGAGMADLHNAAGFVKANMPLSRGNTLSDQQAWDVAQFIDSQERPQDPRFTGDVASTRKQFHDTENSLYGTMVNGKLLGQGIR
ncbi:MAG: c-type cytochrome [Comamonas sp.]